MNAQQKIITNIENAQLHESGMALEHVTSYQIGVGESTMWRGRSYIDLPSWNNVKKACVNTNNDDNKCFEYSVKCGWYDIHTKTNPHKECVIIKMTISNIYQCQKTYLLNVVNIQ